MRFPQSFTRPLSVYFVRFPHTSVMLLLFALAPVNAVAGTTQLACSPSSLRFGKVDVGQSETLMLTLTNSGKTSVSLSTITASNPAFAISGAASSTPAAGTMVTAEATPHRG